jgi:2,4-diketo-3-deoxy-L-fuconate hydrolase
MSALPFARPRQVIAVGLNYRAHADEASVALPTRPVCFAKFTSCLIGPGQAIRIPPDLKTVDYEAELAVVIGRSAYRVGVDDAFDFVAGYTCLNDVTDRETQTIEGQWSRAKSFDTFGPFGPRMVPTSEISDPQNLKISSRLNGELVQDGNTSQMVHTVAQLIAFITSGMTLEEGDMIATGTPEGVGAFRAEPLYLSPGDEISVEIEGIGTLTNPVVSAR